MDYQSTIKQTKGINLKLKGTTLVFLTTLVIGLLMILASIF